MGKIATPPNQLITVGTHPRANYVPDQPTAEARKADKARLGKVTSHGVVNREFTMRALHDFLNAGNALFAASSNGRRLNEFATRQTATLDSDNGGFTVLRDAARAFNARTGFAVSVGETATVGNGRLNVGIDGTITDEHIYALAINFLIEQIGAGVKLDIDDASGVLSQYMLGYGRKSGEYFAGTLIPLSYLMDGIAPVLTKEAEAARVAWELEQRAIYKPIIPASSAGEAFFNQLLDELESDLSNLPAGSNRKRACIAAMINPATYIAHFPDGEQRLIAAAVRGMTLNKAMHDYPGNEKNASSALWAIYEGLRHGKAKPMSELRVRVGYRKPDKKSRANVPAPVIRMDMGETQTRLSDAPILIDQYLSEALDAKTILNNRTTVIIAPTGVGKTSLMRAVVALLGEATPITGIAPLKLLVAQLAKALGAHSYADASGTYQAGLSAVARLVTTAQSLTKFDRAASMWLFLDEIESLIQFILSSGTFKGNAATRAFEALEALLKAVPHVIACDANTSPITLKWLESLRGAATVYRFALKQKARNPVILIDGKAVAFHQTLKLLTHPARKGMPVLVGSSSEKTTSQAADYFTEMGYRVLKVTKDTSGTDAVYQASLNAAVRAGYDVICYDGSWGSGVDISEPVFGQVCILDRTPLDPQHAVQLFGRVRNCTRRYIACPQDAEGYKTPTAAEIVTDTIIRETWSATRGGRVPEVTGTASRMLLLHAEYEAVRRAETAQFTRYLVQRLEGNGFACKRAHASAPDTFVQLLREWLKERDADDWETTKAARGATLSDAALDGIRMSGKEITRPLHLANTLYHIENALASEDVTDYDRDLATQGGRERHYRLCAALADAGTARAYDTEQALEGVLPYKRAHSELERASWAALFGLMGFTGELAQQLTAFTNYFAESRDAADVEACYPMLLEARAQSIIKSLGHHGNNTQTITGLVRWIAQQFGFKIASKQAKRAGQKFMCYRLDYEAYQIVRERAERANANRALWRSIKLQEWAERSPKNVLMREDKHIFVPPLPDPLSGTFKIADPVSSHVDQPKTKTTGWAARPQEFDARIAALTAPIGRGY